MASADPFLTVVRGNPTAEELAAVLAVLVTEDAAGSGPGGSSPAGSGPDGFGSAPASGYPGARRASSGWASRHALLRQPVHPAPGAWRRSALHP